MKTFEQELQNLINKYSKYEYKDTRCYILTQYLRGCLNNWNKVIAEAERWSGIRSEKCISMQI